MENRIIYSVSTDGTMLANGRKIIPQIHNSEHIRAFKKTQKYHDDLLSGIILSVLVLYSNEEVSSIVAGGTFTCICGRKKLFSYESHHVDRQEEAIQNMKIVFNDTAFECSACKKPYSITLDESSLIIKAK